MENNPFRQKIAKQHNVVIKQLGRFRNVWQSKTIDPERLQTYCNSVTYISQLHSTYVHNCMQYFTPMMKQQMVQVNKDIIEDLVNKLRHFSITDKREQRYSCGKEKKQMCQVCHTKIREIDVKIIKQQLSDDAYLRKTLLKKIYADMDNDNSELFTRDEDEVFFKFLNRILVKKEQVLAMQTKEINNFLVQVTKSLSDLNFLTEYTPVKLSSTDYKQNYKDDLSKTISDSLNKGFETKIHPWMEKVFQQIKKKILSQKGYDYADKGCQTGESLDFHKKRSEYILTAESKKQMQSLKEEIEKNIVVIEELRTKLNILERQKKQLEEYYAKEIEELMIGKRDVEVRLRKTQSEYNALRQSKDEEISELTRKLKSQRRKTEPNQNRKSQGEQLKSTKTDAEKDSTEKKNQQLITKKKKKSPINRLLSNKSLMDKQLLSTDNKIELKQEKNEPNYNQLNINQTASELMSPEVTIDKQVSLQPKEVKRTKKSLKRSDRPVSKSNKGQQSQPKVQFSLQKNKVKPKQTLVATITEVIETANNLSDSQQQLPSNISLLTKKKSSNINSNSSTKLLSNEQKKHPKNMKRMVSIQMKVSPITKTIRDSFSKQSQLNPTINEEEQFVVTETLNSNQIKIKSSNNEKKKVFEFVPLENQQQYEELKGKITEVTSKIEMRNTERLKASIKNIQDPDPINSEIGKLYGYSIFNKKATEKSKEKSLLNGSINKSEVEEQDNIKENEQAYDNQNSDGEQITMDRCIQTSFKHISGTSTPGLIDQIPLEQRQSLLDQLKHQSLIPKTLTFHHYELLVRKLFNQSQQRFLQPNNITGNARTSSINCQQLSGMLNKFKQTQSVKINIDAKFLDEVRFGRSGNSNSKVILNLPKLTNYKGLTNSTSKGHLNLNTMRDKSPNENFNDLTDMKIAPQNQKENSPTPISLQLKDSQNYNSSMKSTNSSKLSEVFGQKDLQIFFQSELAAFQYEQSSKHNFKYEGKESSKLANKLSQQQKQLISSLYSILLQVRSKNHQLYHKVFSFVKYPYQTVKHGFDFINIGKDISFQVWNKYISKIFLFKSQKDHQISFTEFIKPFEEKLVQLLVLVNK